MTATTTSVRPRTLNTEHILRVTLATMLGLGCVSFIEPSPYELFFFLLIPVAVLNGLTITRTTLFVFFFVIFAIGAEAFSLMFHLDDPDLDGLKPAMYTVYTTYLWFSALLFALIFSHKTHERVQLALKAFGFSCVFAGVWGTLSYLNVAGIGDHEHIAGRVAGPFKDPNVLGSYCVLGTVFFLQQTVVGKRGYRLINLVGLLITLFGGVFLSFSRGSWGATIFSCSILVISTFVTADRAMRRKILGGLGALALLVSVAGIMVASNDKLRSTITDRAKLEQEYDGGVTGRFGNQKRAIPMLMARPIGFGPHRFASVGFGLDPHNSYIGAFSSGGWIGGCTFILIVLSTSFVALRLAFVASPYRRQAQVICPAIISLFLQAVQIDIDHWRFVFLMIGLIWGLESARMQEMVSALRRGNPQLAPRRDNGLPSRV